MGWDGMGIRFLNFWIELNRIRSKVGVDLVINTTYLWILFLFHCYVNSLTRLHLRKQCFPYLLFCWIKVWFYKPLGMWTFFAISYTNYKICNTKENKNFSFKIEILLEQVMQSISHSKIIFDDENYSKLFIGIGIKKLANIFIYLYFKVYRICLNL